MSLIITAEKGRDLDNLTPLDARNSLLMDPQDYNKRASILSAGGRRGYDPIPLTEQNTSYNGARAFSDGHENLLDNAAGFGHTATHSRGVSADRNPSPDARAPRLPSIDMGNGYSAGNGQWQQQGGHQQQGGYQGHAY